MNSFDLILVYISGRITKGPAWGRSVPHGNSGLGFNTPTICSNKTFMVAKRYAGKTIDTRLNIVFFLLKKNGIKARIPRDEMPVIEEETAVPYSEGELKRLFGAMTEEEKIRYKFFLGTGCREQKGRCRFHAEEPRDRKERTIQPSMSLRTLIMARCYRNWPVDSNPYPVEITGGQSFGEGQGCMPPLLCNLHESAAKSYSASCGFRGAGQLKALFVSLDVQSKAQNQE